MKLPFRYQFILAPSIIVVLLAILIAYTLFEMSKIYRENEVIKNWEVLTDRIQSAIASTNRLNKVINELSTELNLQDNENFFSYLEQTGIVMGTLFDPALIGQLPVELRHQIQSREQLLSEPELANPKSILVSLNELLPALEHQYKLFLAQRRSAFIDNHRQVVAISTRMTIILLSGLMLCIALAAGFALWGLNITRRRLNLLTQRAHTVCVDDNSPMPTPKIAHDELDDLEICLVNMTKRLLDVVGMENVLRGAENERRRIAMDMHDGVLADLTSINRKLDSFSGTSITPGKIKTVRSDVDDVIDHLRRTIDDLHPQVLETLGLEPALRSFLDRHSAAADFPNYHFEFEQDIEIYLPIEHKLNLFRIITEAVNNTIKHARCERMEICLRILSQQLIVTVEDNGLGFSEKTQINGHGCANIAERASLIGATVHWRASRFASGTCLELTLPVNRSALTN